MWRVIGKDGEAPRVFESAILAQDWAAAMREEGIEPVTTPLPEERDWQHSPAVTEALKHWPACQVFVVLCDRCGGHSYFESHAHTQCEWCSEDLVKLLDEEPGRIESVAELMEEDVFAG